MQCQYPIRLKNPNGLQVMTACGHCLHCSIRRQMAWTLRIQLEAMDHESSSFWTLTYADSTRPGDLIYEHIQTFLRRSRKSLGARSVRFFCVGEFGARTKREHWHLILFGVPCPKRGLMAIEQWPHGACFVGEVTTASASYVARYSLKSGPKGGQFLAQMSRRPGIGVARCREIAKHMAAQQPVWPRLPTWWRIGEKMFPLDKTIRGVIRESFLAAGGTLLHDATALELDWEARAHCVVGDPADPSLPYRVEKLDAEAMAHGAF